MKRTKNAHDIEQCVGCTHLLHIITGRFELTLCMMRRPIAQGGQLLCTKKQVDFTRPAS